MANGKVYTLDTLPEYNGPYLTLGDVLVDEMTVPDEFFISAEDLPKWKFQKAQRL